MNDSQDQRALRASDADRDRIAERLREAAAEGRLSLSELEERIEELYSTRTYGELEHVVEDLPGIDSSLSPRAATAPSPTSSPAPRPGRVGGHAGARRAKAVFGGLVRRGHWVVPSRYYVKLVFGGGKLDLREAQLESDEVQIRVKAVFGGAEILVPDDVHVVVDGDGIFGAFDDQASTRQPPAGAPLVRIVGKAVFGGVVVKRGPGATS
ncbi:DUF1707 SHOCT-like domain-containing protein [Phytoactinopolyspora halotolerans]|uniref:DUF1707 domain-containing protein n=1 Tax=Phytoactinopolyspora halotolerans TaxID=1981512 RepID=A0A6L9S457_9ACTN|nr:DUF1707 domain-containing protein [Phytoactinopolyspora halotolerans]NED99818.1 DUF1707 domain-containing protein [Phytoactinopolyspora halotolerans]